MFFFCKMYTVAYLNPFLSLLLSEKDELLLFIISNPYQITRIGGNPLFLLLFRNTISGLEISPNVYPTFTNSYKARGPKIYVKTTEIRERGPAEQLPHVYLSKNYISPYISRQFR